MIYLYSYLHMTRTYFWNYNLHFILELINLDELSISKFKCICVDFSNLEILTKRTIAGEIQMTFAQMVFWNKYLRGTVTIFTLSDSPESLMLVSLSINRAFKRSVKNICLPTMEVILHAAVWNLEFSKKL